MDIDYGLMEDAFLKYQTKPKLTNHGDLYYEGKVRHKPPRWNGIIRTRSC
jgi:hypothetical protein